MNDTSLQNRIADFLKNHPPFNLIDNDILLKLSGRVHVKYYEEGEFLYRAGDNPGEFAYVIRQGGVEKILESDGKPRVVDMVDVGDICGVASLITGKPYRTSTRVMKDTMIYAIPWKILYPLFEIYPKVSLFFASGYAENMPYIRFNLNEVQEESPKLSLTDSKYSIFREGDVFPINPAHEIATCGPDTSVLEAARLITEKNVGEILVIDSQKKPLGIITDVDFRKKVVGGEIPLSEKVPLIMSSPVITIPPGMTAGSLILLMVENNIRHLCVTKDGTQNSEALGIISEHDVLLLHGNNPAILVREIMNIRDSSELPLVKKRTDNLLGQYLIQETSITFVTSIISGINDAIVHKSIQLAIKKLADSGYHDPGIDFCWLEIGSQGRSEQLLATDQDNAIVYDDPQAKDKDYAKEYFLKLAEETSASLAAYGFNYCPSNMMAKNTQWCQPVSQWKKYFSEWIRVPEERSLMHATIFFDFRPVYGSRKLASILRSHIDEEIKHERGFINFLARNALLNPPPLSFFSNLIVENSGEHKNKFDIKLRGTMPLSDAARVLALDMRLQKSSNTIERFKHIAENDPSIADLCSFAISSYELFTKFRALNGLENGDTGRYLDPSKLKKIEKNALKNAFRTIEKIQEHLTFRYRLDFMRS